MADLKHKFVTTAPREKAGPRAAARFEYQVHWALCHLLDLHGNGTDYLIVFDFHDDVVVLDSETQPTKISFYQVKTKDPGTWTVSNLLSRKKGKDGPKLSILGKLYDNVLRFPDGAESINVVSNARFSVALKDETVKSTEKNLITCAEIADSEINKITSKLRREHSLSDNPSYEDIFFLHVADLHLNDHITHTQGKLQAFLERRFPNSTFRNTPIYESMIGEVRRRNKYEGAMATFDDVIKHKAIGRQLFDEILSVVGIREDPRVIWSRIETRLNSEGIGIMRVKAIRDRWNRYSAERTDYSNKQLRELSSSVKKLVGNAPVTLSTCAEFCEFVISQMGSREAIANVYDDEYLWAISLASLYEYE